MSVLDGFEAVGEKTTTNKMTMTVMESSVRFSKGVTEALGCPAYVKLLVNDKQKKIAVGHATPKTRTPSSSARPSEARPMASTLTLQERLLP